MGQGTSSTNVTQGVGSPKQQKNLEVQNQHITQDYSIKKKLGQGNFALVRLCERKSDGHQFAVKIIHKKRLQKPKQQQALDREVDILRKVDHDFCVSLEAIYETSNHLYLVLEYCQGGELFDMICKHNHFTEKQAQAVVRQVTQALMYLHEQGIVHRDIKPENILLLEGHPDSVVKLTDFGLANKLDGTDLKFWTSCGTLYYAAPEVLSSGSYDNKIDFWSLGVVMYVLLVGYLPFYHDNRNRTIELIRKGKVHFDMTDWGEISAEARDLIRKLLNVDPQKRYNAEQVLNHSWFGTNNQNEVKAGNIAKYQNWRRGFENTVQTMVAVRRWKEFALRTWREQHPDSEEEDEWAGVGQGALQAGESPQTTATVDAGETVQPPGEEEVQERPKEEEDYLPGLGFVHE